MDNGLNDRDLTERFNPCRKKYNTSKKMIGSQVKILLSTVQVVATGLTE
jgi:hypothetical protein